MAEVTKNPLRFHNAQCNVPDQRPGMTVYAEGEDSYTRGRVGELISVSVLIVTGHFLTNFFWTKKFASSYRSNT
jgi:hypothetical protein